MVFNSFTFILFFILVYSLYLALQGSHRLQNRMLLAASLVFYGWWDWRFLFLMLITIVTDYQAARRLDLTKNVQTRKKWLAASIVINLSILGFFKYFNFFAGNTTRLLNFAGIEAHPVLLHIILPVGISFYTFQSMSYTLDVYRGKLKPARNFLDYALFVSFFPQLVAGPIERATHLLGQVIKPRTLKLQEFYDGCYLIGWGLFKKMFIADNLAQLVNPVFESGASATGFQVLLALYAFAFQIYCDFSGYSDIARGLGKCMGFDIMVNFNLPYFSASPSEFWQRWHISLSNWLRDYLYIPLGGNRRGAVRTIVNLMLVMLLGGLWHGARWNFVLWGGYHAILLSIFFLLQNQKRSTDTELSQPHPLLRGLQVFIFFHLVCLGWLFFRSDSVAQICALLQSLFFKFNAPTFKMAAAQILRLAFYVAPLLIVQCAQLARKDLMVVGRFALPWRAAFYLICFYLFVIYGANGGQEFIYFQF